MTVINRTDAPVAVAEAGLEIRSIQAGDMYVGFEKWPRARLEALFEGMPGNACQAEHWGFVLKGKMRARTKDGEITIEAGQAYHLDRGHTVLEVLEPAEVVEFTPVKDPYLAETVRVFEQNLPKLLATLKR
ncbi:MAG TPA: hypothetical protein VI997_05910 [Candidatus Thermoplasmatota archaeon]|nr:hypothetical protein [Candidatus Thermoplasmatota archaeon]